MQNFTPYSSLIGGVLIGLGAAAMLIFEGRIAGISGMLDGVLRPTKGETAWKAWFIAGLIAGGLLLRAFNPAAFSFGIVRSPAVLALAGLMVGFGARLANGCTSGHAVCGVGRLSTRSLLATATFVACGALVVSIVNYIARFAQ